MKKTFGTLSTGEEAFLYTISCGAITATVTDFGAHLVSLLVPDADGNVADVVLGFDDAEGYRTGNGGFLGATVGRNANRIAGSSFLLGDTRIRLTPNEGPNNLHSGSKPFHLRFWTVERHTENSITLRLDSPSGDQGFPGNAVIRVSYALEADNALHISYDAVADRDTVFNMTNHAYFNMAGHDHPEKAMDQVLMMTARFYNVADSESIPTGELRSVEGTPMDFRQPKAIGRDLGEDYPCFKLQGGYDHNFEAYADPCAILSDPESGRSMSVSTDCPGIQFYSGNFLCGEKGKDGVSYTYRGGVALETQYYPDSVNHPEWPQPFCKAGQPYHSETVYKFQW